MPIKVPREYVLAEIRYAIDAAQRFFPGKRFETEFVLGVHPLLREFPEELRELVEEYRGSYAIADCVIWDEKIITILEAKLRPAKFLEGWAKLIMYRDLVKVTPRLIEAQIIHADLVLLTPIENPLVHRLCWRENIRNIIWEPPYYKEVLKKYRPTYKVTPEYEVRLEKLLKGEMG